MTWVRTEEEVDIIIKEMIRKSKGKYITQGVAFSKDSESQLKLLKIALMSSYSFGGFVKELIAEKASNNPSRENPPNQETPKVEFQKVSNGFKSDTDSLKHFEKIEKKVGNFV